MLPVSPFTETSGTYVNAQGLPQSFKGTVAFGQTVRAGRSRVLGNVLHLAGFDDETSESVRDTVLAGGVENRLSNAIKAQPWARSWAAWSAWPTCRSIAAMVRRSEPPAAPASKQPAARGRTLTSLGLTAGVGARDGRAGHRRTRNRAG